MLDEAYGTAVVCENGHGLTGRLEEEPERAAKYCSECGAPTLSICPACKTRIRGHRVGRTTRVVRMSYYPPRYCHACGAPYPWTASAIAALREMAEAAAGLSEDDRSKLAASIDDLIRDTPKTELAAQRFKQLASKLAQGTWESMRAVIVSVATEAAKTKLGLG